MDARVKPARMTEGKVHSAQTSPAMTAERPCAASAHDAVRVAYPCSLKRHIACQAPVG